MNNKRMRELQARLSIVAMENDCQLVSYMRTGSGHCRWVVRHRITGRTRKFVTAFSPSDTRSEHNQRAQLRRICHELGSAQMSFEFGG